MKRVFVRSLAVMITAAMLMEGQVATAFAEELPEEAVVAQKTGDVEDVENVGDAAEVEGVGDVEDVVAEQTTEDEESVEDDAEITPADGDASAEINYDDFVIEDGVLVKYTGDNPVVVIPDGVTEIGEKVFCGRHEIKTVKMPSTLKIIGKDAFSFCSSLREADIPQGVTKIGEYAFYQSQLRKVEIPEGLTVIEDGAFSECSLTQIIIPDGITVIGNYAFEQTPLNEVKIAGSVTEIGEFAFCRTYLKEVEIPEGVSTIGMFAFYDCPLERVKLPHSLRTIGTSAFSSIYASLTEIEIPEGVTEIGGAIFEFSYNLAKVKLPSTLRKIGAGAFTSCASMTEIEIPEGVTEIGGETFEYCESLERIKLPESLTTIGKYAFCGCRSLKEIVIPNSVSVVEKGAFKDAGLKEIYVKNKDTSFVTGGEYYDSFAGIKELVVHAPAGSKAETFAKNHGYTFVEWNPEEIQFANFDPSIATRAEKFAYVEYYIRQWRDSLKTEEERRYVAEVFRTQTDVVKAQVKDSLDWLGLSWGDVLEITIKVFTE